LKIKIKKANYKLIIILSILVVLPLIITGCVRGMTPIGWSGVVFSDSNLYTGSKEGRLIQYNLDSAKLNWSEPITITTTSGFGCSTATTAVAIYGTPALANGLVFVAGYNGEVHAYAADNLGERWVYPRKGTLKPIIGSIVVYNDTLYFGCTDGNIYGLDVTTGDKKFQFDTGGEIWSTPAIDNNTLFIGSFDKKIYAIDLASQSKKWDFTTAATNVAPPVTLNGVVYAGSLDRNLYALDQATGNLLWKYTGGNWFWAKPVIYNNIIFAPNLDNHVYGLNLTTGEKIFDYDVGGQVAAWPIIVGNQVIAGTENGNIYALSTDTGNPQMKLIATLPQNVVITAPLAARGNQIFINGSNNVLYSVDVETGRIISSIALKAS